MMRPFDHRDGIDLNIAQTSDYIGHHLPPVGRLCAICQAMPGQGKLARFG